MNKFIKISLIFFILLLQHQVRSDNIGFLHINKHYFTIGERIWFTSYFKSPMEKDNVSSFVCKLLKMEAQHQKMVKAVKVAHEDYYATGYLDIPEHLVSGYYVLAIFPDGVVESYGNIIYQQLMIFNPNDPEGIEEVNLINPEKGSATYKESINAGSISVLLNKERSSEKVVHVDGELKNKEDISKTGTISVSVIDKSLINEDSFLNTYYTSNKDREYKVEKNKNNNYITGTLKIGQVPASFTKVYLFGYQGNDVILDNYISDQKGVFYFPYSIFRGEYDVKFLTYPEPSKTYNYTLDNQLNLDSMYILGIRAYPFENINSFINMSVREYLIKSSYENLPKEKDTLVLSISALVEPSKVVILDEYIDFPTLPEVIREIVPYTTIRYKKGNYILRTNDQRAKDFCCKDEPLLFVNNEPYLEVSEIMKINPEEVYSIEVIRPVEAINAFGDIGVNGILLINLIEGVEDDYFKSAGKAYFRLLGNQMPGSYGDARDMSVPDFRSFLYWEGCIKTNPLGQFSFDFIPSLREGDYCIVICGRTDDGELFFDIQDLN